MQQLAVRHLTLVTFTRYPTRADADVLHAMSVDQQNNFTWWWRQSSRAEWLLVPVGNGSSPCYKLCDQHACWSY
jgi:hypothetical protein